MTVFQTSDLALAAYMITKGLKLVKATRLKSGRYHFEVEDPNDLADSLKFDSFLALPVDPLKFDSDDAHTSALWFDGPWPLGTIDALAVAAPPLGWGTHQRQNDSIATSLRACHRLYPSPSPRLASGPSATKPAAAFR